MKLDQIVLIVIIAGAALWLISFVTTALFAWPWGILALIPVGAIVLLIGIVIYQRLHNKEDDYYEKNVDK